MKKDYENIKEKGSIKTVGKKNIIFYVKDWYLKYVKITPNQELFPTIEIK